jgi:endonuclease III
MSPSKNTLEKISKKLKQHFGEPKLPKTQDPFELIVLENIAYLVDDARREAAFEALRRTIGLRPVDIVAAPIEEVISTTRLGGVHPEPRAHRLKESAQIVLNDFAGDLHEALKLPLPKAIKALRQFPSIGEPWAEKILLFTKAYPLLALDSNGLRVLLRLGFWRGEEELYRQLQVSQRGANRSAWQRLRLLDRGPSTTPPTRQRNLQGFTSEM